MRNEMEQIIKDEFRILAIRTRNCMNLTQREMAAKLEMSDSSYFDIEKGTYMCGTLTSLLLLMLQPDPTAVLKRFEKKFTSLYERELQNV